MRIVLAVFAVLFVMSGSRVVSAPSDLRFSVSPATIDQVLRRGAERYIVVVENSSIAPITFTAALSDVSPSAVPYLQVSLATFTVQPQTKFPLRVDVNLPADAVGGRYASLTIATLLDPAQVAQSGSYIRTRAGVRVNLYFVRPHPANVQRGTLSIRARSADGSTQVQAEFTNTGNIHLRPNMTLALLRDEAVVAKTLLYSPVVLPGKSQSFEYQFRNATGSEVRAIADYGGGTVFLGRVMLK